MKSFLKYGVVPVVVFLALLSLTLVLLPTVVDFHRYIPVIEQKVQKAAGRPFSLGHDITLSFLPGLTLSSSDMRIGNPQGFQSADFVKIASFEGRVELLPLLQGKLEMSRFVMGGVEARLEVLENGRNNWTSGAAQAAAGQGGSSFFQVAGSLIGNMSFALLGITDGQVLLVDHRAKVTHRFDDIMLLVHDYVKGQPVTVDGRGVVDGRSMAVEGKIGPLDFPAGLPNLPLNIAFELQKEIHGAIKGVVNNPMTKPGLAADVSLAPFAPRKLHELFDISFPFAEDGRGRPTKLEASGRVEGRPGAWKITGGKARLEDSTIIFSMQKDDKAESALIFDMTVDQLDLDRYLMRSPQRDQGHTVQNDLLPLSGLGSVKQGSSGKLRFGQLKIGGVKFDRLETTIRGDDRIVALNPITCNLYGGPMQAQARLDLNEDIPETRMLWSLAQSDLAQLSNGLFGRQLLAGELRGEGSAGFYGTNYSQIISTLTGEAEIVIDQGLFSGFDLDQLYSGGDAVFRGFGDGSNGVQTHFQTFKGDVAFRDGVLESRKTSISMGNMMSVISGGIDFTSCTFDVRFTPDASTVVVAEHHAGRMKGLVPIGLTGTFERPMLRVGGSTIQANSGKIEKAVEMESLVAAKVPPPSVRDAKGSEGKTLIDPLVIAERIGLQPRMLQPVPEDSVKEITIQPSRIVIHSLKIKSNSKKM